MGDKIDDLTLLVEKLSQDNKGVIRRSRSDSVFIKTACTIVVACAGFVAMNTISMSKDIAGKADKDQMSAILRNKLSTTSYGLIENRRSEEILDYIDFVYNVKDEDLIILERNKIDKSLSSMIRMATVRSVK